MAVLNYKSVTSAATPASSDLPAPPPAQRPTKIILPKKKPQKWSTGWLPETTAGPRRRRSSGSTGRRGDRPLTSDEFIWNKDFVGRFKRMIEDPAGDGSVVDPNPPVKEEYSGFLSLNRVMALDSLDVDLSKELTKLSKAIAEEHVQFPTQQWQGLAEMETSTKLPTRREQDKWDRATKAATGGSDVMLREARRPRGDPEVLAAQSREQYFKLKKKMRLLTLGVGGVGLVSAYVSYTPEIAASFGAGFVGSLIYIRMLGSTVDSMADGASGLMKGAVGQPRLLVPVVLVMIYNRWNAILVPEYGMMHLELIPMLVWFFTYKITTFLQAIEEAVSTLKTEKRA